MKIIGFPQLFPMDMLVGDGEKPRESTKKKCVSPSKDTKKCDDKKS
jgi:hypothetical protein